MMFVKRRFRTRDRMSGNRDAKLIVIATEGEKTEKKYFEEMVSSKYYNNSRVKILVLEKEDPSASSPEHVLEEISKFEKDYEFEENDEWWLVIDVDRWGEKKLSQVASDCLRKNYHLAVSNPCFEIWLLLHLKSLSEYSSNVLEEFSENKKTGTRNRIDSEILSILGEFNKSDLKVEHFLPELDKAIQRAKELDTDTDLRWPNDLGSRVYRLAESILGR